MKAEGGYRLQHTLPWKNPGLPRISIVTVTWNAERFLEQALDSILQQDYPNLELIVVDGGSTDCTLSIIQAREEKIAYWISEKDLGIYDAMNKGIDLCSGDWVGFKNADDWYAESALKTLAEQIQARPDVDVWYGNSYSVVQESPLSLAPFFTNHLTLGRNPGIDHRSSFVRLSLHRTMKFDLEYHLAADFDVFWRLKKAGAVFAHLGIFVAYKRYGGASDGTQVLRESFAINARHAGWFYALYSRFRSWCEFQIWKNSNRLLRALLGEEGFRRFKSRKIRGEARA
jgi:glycosyltransferase involved in cell wall biosynthesis